MQMLASQIVSVCFHRIDSPAFWTGRNSYLAESCLAKGQDHKANVPTEQSGRVLFIFLDLSNDYFF